MSDTIFLRVGDKNEITLPVLIDALRHFLLVLKNLDATVSKSSGGSVTWQVVSLAKNSPPTVGVMPKIRRGCDNFVPFIEGQLFENVRLLSHKGDRTPYMSDAALDEFEKLAALTPKQGAMSVYLNGDGPLKAKADITEQTLNGVKQLTSVRYSAYGSFVGSLDAISVHKTNEFRIWDKVTKKPVRCKFDESDLERVKSYLKQTVMVAGIVQSNSGGNPISIKIDTLEPIEERVLPTLEEMSGLVDSFHPGKTLKEYMEELSND